MILKSQLLAPVCLISVAALNVSSPCAQEAPSTQWNEEHFFADLVPLQEESDMRGPLFQEVSDRSAYLLRQIERHDFDYPGAICYRCARYPQGSPESSGDVEFRRSRVIDRIEETEDTQEGETSEVEAIVRSREAQTSGPGNFDDEFLASELHRHQRHILSCYQYALLDNPSLGGRLVVQFDISSNGRVESVHLVENDVELSVGACVEGWVRRWRFDVPSGGSVSVRKAYVLEPAG